MNIKRFLKRPVSSKALTTVKHKSRLSLHQPPAADVKNVNVKTRTRKQQRGQKTDLMFKVGERGGVAALVGPCTEIS